MQIIRLDELGLVIPVRRVAPRWTFGRWRPVRLKLRLRTEGELEVIAPLTVSLRTISEFVLSNRDWIESAQFKARTHAARLGRPTALENGVEIMILGQMRILRLVALDQESRSWSAQLQPAELRLHLSATAACDHEKLRLAVRRFSEKLVRHRVTGLVEQCSQQMGLFPNKLRFGWQDTRWGSCSSIGTISFNCRLAIAPIETIRYVVVHELAHLKEPNHSKRFWSIVESQCADFKAHNQWLKKNQAMAWYL